MAALFFRRHGLSLALVVIVGVLGWQLYDRGWDRRDEQCKAQDTAERLQASRTTLDSLLQLTDFQNQISGAYVRRRQITETVYRTLRVEVPHVVEKYIPAPGHAAVPVPDCVYTNGFKRVWNAALQGQASGPNRSTGGIDPAVAGGRADPAQAQADRFDSGLSTGEVLDNHVINAHISQQVRDQCEALRQYVIGQDHLPGLEP